MSTPRPRRVRGDLLVNAPGVPWDAVLALPFGRLGVRCTPDELLQTEYLPAQAPERAPQASVSALVEELRRQLLAYCADPHTRTSLPMRAAGTPFQRDVWQALCEIPAGTTLRYGELARALGSAARAVGQACAANPFAPLVPCHRVVAVSGLGGFAGSLDARGELLRIKRWLLQHEGAFADTERELFGNA